MRIFFVTNNYTPYSGGVVQSITSITDQLRTHGHEIFIITLDFLGTHNDPDYVIRIPCPIKFIYKKNHMAIPWRSTHAIEQLIKTYSPDIIHVHHPFLLGKSALRAARKYRISCVFTYHTLYEQYAHYIPLPRIPLQLLIRKSVLRFCRKVDAIIAPSTSVQNYLISYCIQTPITVIPSPLRSCFINQTIKKTSSQKNTCSELLFVGRFMQEKNIPFIFEVMKLLPDRFTATLVGYGADYEKIQKLARQFYYLPPERVRFIHKPSEEKLKSYQSADLFIFPSTTDTQGIVLAESMSQGLPVIALDGPGQRDIIINDTNGFIITNAQEAAEKIMQLAHNPQMLAHLSVNARKTALHYHPYEIVNRLLSVYGSV
jgi:1,2-diacylglycerol 3-alpha-glucosyltransferase